MSRSRRFPPRMSWLAAAAGLAAGAYAGLVAMSWRRYGHPTRPRAEEHDPRLDEFMPVYDVVERHHIRVAAPATITLLAAQETDLQGSGVVRAIIKARELMLGAKPDTRQRPHGLLAEVQSIGWGVLADIPGHEVIVGAVTKPWEANVTFRSLPPEQFAAFREPGYVKIVWTLRADPVDAAHSVFRTETRAVATDAAARAKFRTYWSFVAPGIITIRWALLGPVKREAERRARNLNAEATV